MRLYWISLTVLATLALGCGGDDSVTGPGDTSAPTVSLSADRDSVSTMNGSVTLTAIADDDTGVASVSFYENGALLGTDTSAPYLHTINYDAGSNGDHDYTSVAKDAAGNSATSGAVRVTITIPSLPFFDDFEDGILDPTQWEPNDLGDGSGIQETNGRLELFIAGSASGSGFGEGVRTLCTLTGDYDVQVDYELLTWPAQSGVRSGMVVGGWSTQRDSFASGDFNSSESYAADHWSSIHTVVTDHMSGTLRSVREGNTVTSYYRDGTDWVPIQVSNRDEAEYAVTLQVWSHDGLFSGQDVRIAFDNFRINLGTLSGCE